MFDMFFMDFNFTILY